MAWYRAINLWFLLAFVLILFAIQWALDTCLPRRLQSSAFSLISWFLSMGVLAIVLYAIHKRLAIRSLRTQLLKRGEAICLKCGYDLTGNTSDVCPECGTPARLVDGNHVSAP